MSFLLYNARILFRRAGPNKSHFYNISTYPHSKQLKFIKNQVVEVLEVLTATTTHIPKQSLCRIKTSSMTKISIDHNILLHRILNIM
jgi:hypothetical protein